MKRSIAILLLAGCATSQARSFPPVDQLPARGFVDPLEMLDGRRVTTPEQWMSERRPELKALFEHYMYGSAPAWPVGVKADVLFTDPKALGGKATLREIKISWGIPTTIHLLLATPNGQKRAPCVFGLNFDGNHTVLADKRIRLPEAWMRIPGNKAREEDRGTKIENWSIEASIDRGYAIGTLYMGDIDPDRHDWSDGIHPHYYKPGQKEPGPHEWATIRAWAWGLSRVVDFLVTDPAIDSRRLAVFGHSRNGKTALVAGAYDDRIALVLSHQSGCGGTAPSRSTVGESVARINTAFPHWFNDTFVLFNDKTDRLPFDQHCLAAICAPRPVLYSNAQDDQWANPTGQFEMLKAATPVYNLLGAEGLKAEKPPSPGDPLISSRLGFWLRPGKHSTTPEDWKIFLDFCDAQLK
jgi:hypothetical protein